MPATRTVLLGDHAVTVRELTVGEVRAWMLELETRTDGDAIGDLALDECTLDDLAHMTDASARALEAFAPSELMPLVDACKGLNPHFFKVRAALSSVARLMQAEAITSTAPAASS